MVRPICFIIMPYGIKPTQQYGQPGPDLIDFDRLWAAAFEPAIRQMGFEPVRADQGLGAFLMQDIIERLVISDLVIADVTLASASIYYEIGVRHAANPTDCVIVGADWARPAFDISQMRQIRYPLPSQAVDDATADQIRRILVEGVPRLAKGRSPVFEFLPGYPAAKPNYSSSFRRTFEEMSAFQSEVSQVRSSPRAERAQRAIELRDRMYSGGPIPTPVALELLNLIRDCTDFQTTLRFIDLLPVELQQNPTVREQRALAVSKSGDHLASIEALRQLIAIAGDTSERRGLLGGRYKKLYAAERDPRRQALYLDRAIEEYEQGMLLDLNDYYPSSNLARLYRVRNEEGDEQRARMAASVTALACERARQRGLNDPWLKPTLLLAAFNAGDVPRAKQLAREIRREGPEAWHLETMMTDLKESVALNSGETSAALARLMEDLEQTIALQ